MGLGLDKGTALLLLTTTLLGCGEPERVPSLGDVPASQPALPGPAAGDGGLERVRPAGHRMELGFGMEPAQAAPGQDVTLRINAVIDPGWHTYAMTMDPDVGPRPTKVEFSDLAGLEPGAGWSVDPEPTRGTDPAFGVETEYHEGMVTWTLPLHVPVSALPGKLVLKGIINNQLCDEKSCLPPRKVDFAVSLEIAAGNPETQ